MENRKLLTAILAFLLLLAIGTIGYRQIEGDKWSYFDGFFMTVITLATVGYNETHPLTNSGRVFTVCLLLIGAGVMAYTLSSLVQFVIDGKFREIWGKRLMKEKIRMMKNHYVLCGAGNTGLVVAEELMRKRFPFIVIDSNAKIVEELREAEIPVIEGDATLDEVLLCAGLEKATGLVTALPHDADNVFVTLTAKGINQNLFVISTASKTESIPKLKRAGANYVVSPNIIAGARMATVIMRPTVIDFLDTTISGDNQSLQMEEFMIQPRSFLEKKALKDAEIRQRSGAIIVSVKRGNKSVINPEPTYVFESGDIMIVLGDLSQISKIGDLASGSSRV